MPSILLFGPGDRIVPFAAGIPDTWTVYLAAAAAPEGLARPVTPVDPAHEFGAERPDVVADLYVDRESKEDLLGLLASGGFPGAALVSNTLTMTATDVAARIECAMPVIGISYIPSIFESSSILEAATALQNGEEASLQALARLKELTGKELERVVDRVALVSARTLAMIINEAAFALMEGVAGVDDIDTAMKLGTNYPEGPLRWADRIGLDVVLSILDALHAEYREERYRPCVLLRQLVRAGQPIGA
ncbi:MAG TPA: 3-hydroxyacyl-CoA dehydrogenase family protein [Candidatus Kapabacteria bacterium]|nr:3-hydroxyacyl-CoA dehydrogenase family protein [Candidatus Kapabacteria bacterium]